MRVSSSFFTLNSQIQLLPQIPSKSNLIPTPKPIITTNTTNNPFNHLVINTNYNRNRTAMAASSISSSINTDQFNPFQLDDMSDFYTISSPTGNISICGFGSLLSERSARSTFPELSNFRIARLKGFRRVFAHVAPIFFERGIAKPETKEISSLSVEPYEGEELIVTVFEIQKSEVLPETIEGKPFENPAVLCTRYSDEEFFNVRCKGSKEVYHQHYGRFNIDKIWRDDVFPCRTYMRHCVLAAKNLGDAAYNNFVDHTYLADRQTTIRQYLETTGAGIMEEEPPESLKTRYGG